MRDRLIALARRVKETLTPGGSLFERSVTGGIWLTLQNVAGRVIQLLTLVTIANLLSPRAFGIIGIAMLVIVALKQFSELGLNEALIYDRQENVDAYLNTVWVINGLRGLAMAAILVAGAPVVGWVFGEPTVVPLLRLLAIGPLVFSLKNPAIVYFRKRLDFHKQFAYQVSGDVAYLVVGLGYALVEPTVWALGFAVIARNVTRFALSFLLHDYRPRPSFDLDRAREMIDYGKWITASTIASYVRNQGDDAFVGWLLGSSALGFYQIGYLLSNSPATEVTHVISKVTFPAYSEVQDDLETLREAFFRTVRVSSFLAAPMAMGILVVAPTFVKGYMGSEWIPMVVPMQILAIYGLARGYASSFGSVWRATGNPDYLFKVQLLAIVLMALPLYPMAVRYGITGVSLVITGVYVLFMLPIDMYLATSVVEASPRRLAREFAYPLPATGVMTLVVFWARETVELSPVFELPLLVVVGAVTYFAAVAAMASRTDWNIFDELRDVTDAL